MRGSTNDRPPNPGPGRSKEGGASRDVAEHIATEIYDAISSNVATKADVALVRADLREMELRLEKQIDRVVDPPRRPRRHRRRRAVRRAALLAAALSSEGDNLDLTVEEKQALIALLKRTLEHARLPLAPRLDPLKAIMAKVEPPAAQPER
jgi:hypothetical protein